MSPPGRATLRYNPASGAVEVSADGSAYLALSTGGGGASPWVDDGAGNVRLQNLANDVTIGAAAAVGSERLRVVGDVRAEGQVQAAEVTSVPGSALDLELSADTGNINATVTGAFSVVNGLQTALDVDISVGTVSVGEPANPLRQLHTVPSADAAAYLMQDPAGNSILAANTTVGSETIDIGNTTTDPNVRVLGSGRLEVTTIDRAGFIDIGPALSTTLRLGRSGFTTTAQGQFSVQGFATFAQHAAYVEQAGDPGATANQGKVYTKDVAGRTELFYLDNTGAGVQMTSGGSPAPGGAAGANTQVQYNSAGALAGNANFTFNGTNVTLANALFANGGVDRSAVGTLGIAQTNATAVTVGQVTNPITTTVTVPDNTGNVFRVTDVNGDNYINVATTNFTEFVSFGNNNTSPDYFFQGASIAMSVGASNSGRVEAASFGPGPLVGFNRAMFVGTETQATAITIGQSAATLTINSSDIIVSDAQISLVEVALDPGGVANQGRVYTKDVSTVTELFYQDSAGGVVQITAGGFLASPEIPTNTASAYTITDTTTAATYLDITTTTAGETITIGGSQNPVVDIDTTGNISIGAAAARVGFFGTAPTGQTAAYTPTNVTTDRSYDANATTLEELADVVGTMIADLQLFGLFG